MPQLTWAKFVFSKVRLGSFRINGVGTKGSSILRKHVARPPAALLLEDPA